MVEPGVLGQIELLVAQARGQLAKPELVQRVYNNLADIQAALGVQVEVASGVEEHLEQASNKEDDNDVV